MRLLLSASPREIPPKNPQLTAPRADGPMRINQPNRALNTSTTCANQTAGRHAELTYRNFRPG